MLGRHAVVAKLELQVGDDRGQVRVAAALAVAVDGALHLAGAGTNRGEGVGHAAARVVVGVDPDRRAAAELVDHGGRRARDLVRKRGPVGVAEHHRLGPGVHRRAKAAQGVVGVVAEGVEEVLDVVDHALALGA